MTALEFRKNWSKKNPQIIHIPSDHELFLMEQFSIYENLDLLEENKLLYNITEAFINHYFAENNNFHNLPEKIQTEVNRLTNFKNTKGNRKSIVEGFKELRELGTEWDKVKCVCEELGRSKCELNCPEHSDNNR